MAACASSPKLPCRYGRHGPSVCTRPPEAASPFAWQGHSDRPQVPSQHKSAPATPPAGEPVRPRRADRNARGAPHGARPHRATRRYSAAGPARARRLTTLMVMARSRRIMVWLGALVGCVVISSCADDREEFVACLSKRGGTVVSRQQQIARLDWQRAEDGGGVAVESWSSPGFVDTR